MHWILPEDIIAATSEVTYTPIPHLLSRRRTRRWARPRQIAMFLCREMTKLSLPQIGRRFERDHTTILHAMRAMRKRVADSPETARLVDEIRTLTHQYAEKRRDRFYNPYRITQTGRDTLPRDAAISGAGGGNAIGYQKSMDE